MADVEQEDPKSTVVSDESNRTEFKEASFLLAFWSILVMNEGVIRFVQHGRPGGPGLFTGNPVRFWGPFLGGLFECIFGLVGLFVGLSGSVFDVFNRTLILVGMGIQTVLGWYVFIDYVFVIPAIRIANDMPPMPYLPRGSRVAVGWLGILTSFCWCLALQGGQFVFMCRMLAYGGTDDFARQRTGNKMRALFWNAVYMFAGLFASATGIIVLVGSRRTLVGPPPYFGPPNVGRLPVYLLITGLIMTLWPLVGMGIVLANRKDAVRRYLVVSFFVFVFSWIHYTIGSLGYIAAAPMQSNGPAAGAAMHNHLAFMLSFLGPYFMLKYSREAEGSM